MKARVKSTGEIVEIIDMDFDTLFCNNGGHYTLEQIEGIECNPGYWTRLEHQYAGMAMQGIISRAHWSEVKDITEYVAKIAHALVEKMKEEERK